MSGGENCPVCGGAMSPLGKPNGDAGIEIEYVYPLDGDEGWAPRCVLHGDRSDVDLCLPVYSGDRYIHSSRCGQIRPIEPKRYAIDRTHPNYLAWVASKAVRS